MFGYVRPLKCELKIKEFDSYKAVYCALCFSLQKNYGALSKAFLNYDFVFGAMLGLSVSDYEPAFCPARCNTNLLKKCSVAKSDEIIDYCAAALCVSVYHKLRDDIKDERFFGRLAARMALPTARAGYKKAKKRYPSLAACIGQAMDAQALAEANSEASVDSAADSTARALAHVFEGLSSDEDKRRVLLRMGYLTGRFVYLADCGDDLADDLKKGRFNPLIGEFSISSTADNEKFTNARQYIRGQLYLTAAELSDCYDLLTINSFRGILDNIIHLGLYSTADTVFRAERKKKDDKSL